MRILILSVLFSFLGQFGISQIAINTSFTPTQLVNNYLIGNGVAVSNIVYTGEPQQIGQFNGTFSNIGLSSGIVLSSGDVSDIVPPNQPDQGEYNNPGDPDLLTVAQSVTSNPDAILIDETWDAAILEFDFVPQGDTVTFRFVFASEEYTTYINTSFNDVFGFFLSGPGFTGPYAAPPAFPGGAVNLALVPGTSDPITISTIYNDPFSTPTQMNASYYVGSPTGHSFNGFTIPITVEFRVTCGETYHFKFAIADCQDDYLDSGVFLEGGSFSSEAVEVAVATVSGDTAVYEGCSSADFIFSRPTSQIGTTLSINYAVSGTAMMGSDYNTFPSPIVFNPGEDTVIVNFIPTDDGITESPESVTITAYVINDCGDLVESTGTVWILDHPELELLIADTTILCKDDSVLVTAIPINGLPSYDIQWSDGQVGDTAYVSGDLNGAVKYYVTVTDQCGNTIYDSLTVNVNQTLAIDTLISTPSQCDPTGSVQAFTSGVSGIPFNHWSGPGATNPNGIDATVWLPLSAGWYYFTVTDNACEVTDSVFVDLENPPKAQFTATPVSGCAPLTVNFTNSSENAYEYNWNFGNGQTANVTTTESQSQVYNSSALVRLIASQGSCKDTAYATVSIIICGCNDPNALNFNPFAMQDDGSCFYPVPTVSAPNVFSPNGDNANEFFFLTTTYTTNIELTILNRWGNVMYESSGVNPAWNGKTQSGGLADDGVYFYKYKVYGFNDQTLEGHGFLHLVR